MDVVFVTVRRPVIVSVEVGRVCTQLELDDVLQPIAVAISRGRDNAGRSRLCGRSLLGRRRLLGRSACETIERIAALRDLVSIEDTVAVGIGAQR